MAISLTRIPKRIGYGLVPVLVSSLLVTGTAAAEEAEPFTGRDDLRTDEPVEVTPVEPSESGFVDPSADQVWRPEATATEPPQPTAVVFGADQSRPAVTAGGGGQPAPEGFPVSVTTASYGPSPYQAPSGPVRVELLDQQAAEAAGVAGVLMTVSGAGLVDLSLDYSRFADLYGGGWGSRLGLVELPACAVTTPQADGCLETTPVVSTNRAQRQTLSSRIRLDRPDAGLSTAGADAGGSPAGVRVFAVTAGEDSEGSGDYSATDLSPAGSWSAGGNDGTFTYGYPLRVPPAAGPVPDVSLGYSSASHDGRTSGSNNQASWIGDGWGYQPGFIERSYKPCSLDTDGGNNADKTGDQCWDGDSESVTLSLNGTNTTLVRDDDSGEWHSAADANWRIELLGSPASSSGGTSERWKVTTPDGTRYFFSSETGSSDSRLTVPVFGNHSGEPCHASGFADSSCRQAYRWLLDKVVDVHGNMIRYFYDRETGHYGAAGDPDERVSYHRSSHLVRIEYGLRADDDTVDPTGRVLFTADDRCLSDCGTASNPTEENWPDTPWDLHCDETPCTTQVSPAFFSTKRLAEVTTQVRDGSGFRDVDSWTLEHEFKDYGDGEQAVLWLKSIQHTGHVGDDDITLPKVEFAGEALPNRVDAAAGVPVMWRWRLSSIKTEAGAVITVTYSAPECTPSDLPADAHTNSMRCYPVRWTPEFFTEPVEDWFHKYVVTSVIETDTTGGMPAVETYYEYSTNGGGTPVLWAWDDSEFTEDEHRTYGQWRGYAQVTTRVGNPAEGQTTTRARFYRGLDGQPLPSGGERDVDLTDAESNTVPDHEALAGMVWESLSYNGSTVIGGSTTRYWTRKTATQHRDHDGGDLEAWVTGPSVEKTRTRLTSSDWQRTETRISYDNRGRQTEVSNLGDTAKTGDETCTRREYADNVDKWLRRSVKRTELVAVDCGTTPSRPDDLISDRLIYFDGSETHGSTPARGAPTRVDVLDDWDDGPTYTTTTRYVYDALGRVVETLDALGNASTTAYTPAGPGPVTEKVLTNPLGHTATTELEPAWGMPIVAVDPNGRRTDLEYDALGRSTAVWLPGRNPATQTASKTFEYRVRDGAPSAVTTKTINHLEDYVIEVVLYDSLLRQRQTQTETADHGRVLTETLYDTQGRVDEEYGPNHNTDPPGTSIVHVGEADSARRIGYLYDGAGRVTDEIFYNKHVERWRTVTSYGGSEDGFMTATHPPDGAPATATIINARDETIERRTYHGNAPSGDYDTLTYEYDPAGRLVEMTDQAGNQWSWEYDLRGHQIAAHDPDAGTTTMTYDDAGQLISSTDARGETIVNGYDPLGRQTTRHDGDGTLLAEWEYDTALGGIGMLGKSTRWADGNAYTKWIRAVNPMGLVSQTAIIIPASEGDLAGTYWFTQSHYPNGQVAGQGFDDAGDVEGGLLFREYDHVGNPTGLIFDGDYTGVTVVVDEATFTPFNEVQTRRLGASYARHAYHGFVYEEGTRRLERATFDREASITSVADRRYSYDPAGNLLSVADVPDGLPGNHELQCFQYDARQRLVEAWAQGDTSECAATPSTGMMGGPAPYWNSYQHDATGNRTSETLRTPGDTETRTYTYPDPGQPHPHALQQVTSSSGTGQMQFTYDQAGNTSSRQIDGQTQTLSWNTEGKIDGVQDGGDTLRMVYDADGNRLIRDDGDTVTAYLPQTELTWDRTTDTVDGTRYFSHAGQVVAVCTGQDPADWTFTGADHHGTTTTHSVNAFTAVEQVRRMDPYGNPRGTPPASWPGQQGFVGGVEDPTGLIHIGARSYDPTTGRFLSIDAILHLEDSQQINGYAYANNNPITFTDPTGLCVSTPYGYYGRGCLGGDTSDSCPAYLAGCLKWHRVSDRTAGNGGSSTASSGSSDSTPDTPAADKPLSEKLGEFLLGAVAGAENWAGDNLYATLIAAANPGHTAYMAWYQMGEDYIYWLVKTGESGLASFCAVSGLCEIFDDWDNGNYYGAGYQVGQLGVDALLGLVTGRIGGVPAAASRALTLLKRAAGGACRNSFEAGTLVLMADGSYKPIEDVEVGDEVLATDPAIGTTETQPVTHTITGTGHKILVEITVASGDLPVTTTNGSIPPADSNGELLDGGSVTATVDHPFWVANDHTWTPAGHLQPGDQLLTANQATLAVRSLNTYHDTLTVYNLTTKHPHTYHILAGYTPVLVHNCGGIDAVSQNIANHANARFSDPGGMDHYVRGVDPNELGGYVDDVINDRISNVEVRFLRGGRIAYWDPNKSAVVIEEGDGGTVFTPREGRTFSMISTEGCSGPGIDLAAEAYSVIFQITKEFPNLPMERLVRLGIAPEAVTEVVHTARIIRDAGRSLSVTIDVGDVTGVEVTVTTKEPYRHTRKVVVARRLINNWRALLLEVVSWLDGRELFLRTGYSFEETSPILNHFLKGWA